jgi:ERCC4-type nuclease
MNASIEELTEVDGRGRISAEKIREVLYEEFLSD